MGGEPSGGGAAAEGSTVRAKSPLRISFAGGGTDLPAWYETRGGAVLSCTLGSSAYVTLYPRADRRVVVRSLDLGYAIEYGLDEQPAFDGVLDLAKAAVRRFAADRGFDIDIRSDAPAGGGLGGSSALTAAMVGALALHAGKPLAPREAAELACAIERDDLGIAGGMQDQYATAFGGFNRMAFDRAGVTVAPLRLDPGVRNDLEAHLLLCYVGRVRKDAGLIARQTRFIEQGRAETIEGMRRIQAEVGPMAEALLAGELERFGRGLHRAFVHKKMMNPHITDGTAADLLYEAALEQGALGGKLLGAGGGGYMLIYAPTARQHAVRAALEARGGRFMEFTFGEPGLQAWRSRAS